MAKESDFGTFVVGFFFGALLGGAAGFAVGQQRDQIEKSIELSEQATEKAEEAREALLADAHQKFEDAPRRLQHRAPGDAGAAGGVQRSRKPSPRSRRRWSCRPSRLWSLRRPDAARNLAFGERGILSR